MKNRLDATAVAALLLCCLLWGLNQVAIKAALPEVPPLIQLSLRSVGAAVLLLTWMRMRGIRFSLDDGTLWPGLLAGALFAVEFACIFIGLQHTTAARSTVFINTSPLIVAAVLAAFVPAERLRPRQVAGLLIAFGAVALAFAEGFGEGGALLGDALALAAAVLWGLTTVTIRMTVLRRAPAELTLAYQLLVAAILAPLAAWVVGERWPADWSALALGSVFYQTVIVTFASYLLWFWLLTRYPATRVQSFAFLTPVSGLLFAVLLLGEPLGWRLVLALVGVIAGITLVNRRAS
ncbi:DMT family transporter [Rivibacter subsaxonicus]|uniref:Drug/metabolite transporter (DMT)-like permease n=1 Tax=Rivibacter subsaxonicus TaxID=457575 RepID=A0A4Q7VG72_9BURK|nr:DMT family transporter [Rivibacter subsaxonicus]RZT95010.1 drug/metabolite transporter (DMT)-like permease [Rivibacter subsaxonicus]